MQPAGSISARTVYKNTVVGAPGVKMLCIHGNRHDALANRVIYPIRAYVRGNIPHQRVCERGGGGVI